MRENLLWIVVGLLVLIAWELDAIRSRLKYRFPTDEVQDSKWAQEDPHGHWEAHKNETESRNRKH
jgi:hypothetical protein